MSRSIPIERNEPRAAPAFGGARSRRLAVALLLSAALGVAAAKLSVVNTPGMPELLIAVFALVAMIVTVVLLLGSAYDRRGFVLNCWLVALAGIFAMTLTFAALH